MPRNRLLSVLLVTAGLLVVPVSVRADDDGVAEAMRRLADADAAMHSGRPNTAFEGYLAVIRRFPTWWIPTVKAAVAARALHMPDASVDAWVNRARTLEPSGDYLPLVAILLALDRDHPDVSADLRPVPSGDPDTGVSSDPASVRLAMARAAAFEHDGRVGAAVVEYRALLADDVSLQAARFRLARLLVTIGRRDEAAAMFRDGEARSLNPARWREAARQALEGGSPK